ncbi:MAG: chorismate synthase [Anaerolineaceae bacterium]|nr:chorismate synthase [Anaerolineaceae bacterium]
MRLLTSGESHGPGYVMILDGLPAGLVLEEEAINRDLTQRQQGAGAGLRMKIEKDRVKIIGGVMENRTTGGPLSFFIENLDHKNWRGRVVKPFVVPRPGHADLSAAVKYGYDDLRLGLERASARETSARVAAGAVCRILLKHFQIQVGGYVSAIGPVAADLSSLSFEECINRAHQSNVFCPDSEASQAMEEAIDLAGKKGDTLGGIIEVAAVGLPVGLGSFVQWDRRLDARLAYAIMSIPAVKGVEFGPAFENSGRSGSQVQDAIDVEGGELVRKTNRAGGLEGGITNGEPLHVRAAFKPIPTLRMSLPSVDLFSKSARASVYERSDTCQVPRAVVVVEAMTAFTLADALLEKLGGDTMQELTERFKALKTLSLENLSLSGRSHIFWPAEESND